MVQLHSEHHGGGAPVVFTHGLGDDSGTWAELVPLLPDELTAVTWDLRGHGRSDAPSGPDGYSMELAIGDLLQVIESASGADGSVHLVGHSLGGFLSMAVALRRPSLVRSLTMIASGPGFRDATARERWNRHVDAAVLRMPVPPEAAALAHQGSDEVMAGAGALVPPLLLVVGERDERFHAGVAYLAKAVPGCRVHRVGGAGHHPQRTHAGDVAPVVVAHITAASTS
jgi:pimeloyl-ACP methyl ester carboxylesterase